MPVQKQPAKSLQPTPDRPPTLSALGAASSEPAVLDFIELDPFERYLYCLQQGASLDASNLPKAWEIVLRALYDDGHISYDQLIDTEEMNLIPFTYQKLQLGVQAFYRSTSEPTDERNLTVRHMEEFDVFDKKPGGRYWRRHSDSILQPASFKVSPIQPLAHTDSKQESSLKIRSMEAKKCPMRDEAQGAEERAGLTMDSLDAADDEEFGKLLSFSEQSLADNGGAKEASSDFAQETQFESESTNDDLSSYSFHAVNRSAEQSVVHFPQLGSPPELFGASSFQGSSSLFGNGCIDPRKIQHRTSTPTPFRRAKRRKIRHSPEIIVHEDSPRRETFVEIPESPGTDIPKENFDQVDSFLHDLDPNMRIPRERPRVVYGNYESPGLRHRRSTNTTPSWGVVPIGSSQSAF